jgi:hypothetical protein
MKYYYDLDSNGSQKARYARPQKDKPDLVYLEEAPSKEHIRANNSWEVDVLKYAKDEIKKLKSNVMNNWLDINKTRDQIKTQWTTAKETISSAKTKQDVDTVIEQLKTWLGL